MWKFSLAIGEKNIFLYLLLELKMASDLIFRKSIKSTAMNRLEEHINNYTNGHRARFQDVFPVLEFV